ncbi:hypothetical protein Hanom_Chr16g01453551 [Helianthus anomalus]
MFLFQLLLPLSTINDDFLKQNIDEGLQDLFKEISSFDFGEDVKFGPTRSSTKFLREKVVMFRLVGQEQSPDLGIGRFNLLW